MEENGKTCPFCGAYFVPAYGYDPHYQCGTLAWKGGLPDADRRSPKCYEAELAALREELSREKLGYQSLASHAEVHERELKAEIAALKEKP